MESSLVLPVYDHVIMDSEGIKGFKDGKEYPISEEDWKKAHPEHRYSGCKECAFASDIAQLFAFNVSREVREKATKEPKFVGKFTMSGWTGHSGFYLFKCAECGSVGVDYPHGYHGSYWYLRCGECNYTLDLNSSRYRSIYQDNDGFVPKFIEEIGGWMKRQIFRLVAKN